MSSTSTYMRGGYCWISYIWYVFFSDISCRIEILNVFTLHLLAFLCSCSFFFKYFYHFFVFNLSILKIYIYLCRHEARAFRCIPYRNHYRLPSSFFFFLFFRIVSFDVPTQLLILTLIPSVFLFLFFRVTFWLIDPLVHINPPTRLAWHCAGHGLHRGWG